MQVDDLELFQIAIYNSAFFPNHKSLKLLMKVGYHMRSPDCTHFKSARNWSARSERVGCPDNDMVSRWFLHWKMIKHLQSRGHCGTILNLSRHDASSTCFLISQSALRPYFTKCWGKMMIKVLSWDFPCVHHQKKWKHIHCLLNQNLVDSSERPQDASFNLQHDIISTESYSLEPQSG